MSPLRFHVSKESALPTMFASPEVILAETILLRAEFKADPSSNIPVDRLQDAQLRLMFVYKNVISAAIEPFLASIGNSLSRIPPELKNYIISITPPTDSTEDAILSIYLREMEEKVSTIAKKFIESARGKDDAIDQLFMFIRTPLGSTAIQLQIQFFQQVLLSFLAPTSESS